ncbi:hypothetical protein E8E14_011724 [Neopestalotiopsis sp. 37M]|nr:hypothetical protein E8E14_011724 [Neopestalotiopsis sp. 37M]
MDTVAIPAAANCIIDFLTLILPIREIVKLKISTKRKFKIGGVFLLGGIACAASLVRTIALFDYFRATTNNFTRTARPPSSERRMLITKAEQFVLAGFATLVEIYVAIIGACLPILGPVYQRLRHGGKRGEGHTTPRVARRDGRVGQSTHTLNTQNHRVAGHSVESLDYTFDDDSLTLGAYPGNHRVYIRSDGRNDMP